MAVDSHLSAFSRESIPIKMGISRANCNPARWLAGSDIGRRGARIFKAPHRIILCIFAESGGDFRARTGLSGPKSGKFGRKGAFGPRARLKIGARPPNSPPKPPFIRGVSTRNVRSPL